MEELSIYRGMEKLEESFEAQNGEVTELEVEDIRDQC